MFLFLAPKGTITNTATGDIHSFRAWTLDEAKRKADKFISEMGWSRRQTSFMWNV